MSEAVLALEGPFALTSNSRLPLFSKASCSQSPGIYVQAVKLAHSFRVSYIGETGANFIGRLRSENSTWISGSDHRRGEVRVLDLEPYLAGARSYVPPRGDADQQRRMRIEILDATVVFMAPLSGETSWRRAVEAALIRRLKSYNPAVAEFLYNEKPDARPFFGTITLTMPDAVIIEGLSDFVAHMPGRY